MPWWFKVLLEKLRGLTEDRSQNGNDASLNENLHLNYLARQ